MGFKFRVTTIATPVFETGPDTACQRHQLSTNKEVSGDQEKGTICRLALCLAQTVEEHPDLVPLVESWPELPKAVRAGIVAMVGASAPSKTQNP